MSARVFCVGGCFVFVGVLCLWVSSVCVRSVSARALCLWVFRVCVRSAPVSVLEPKLGSGKS